MSIILNYNHTQIILSNYNKKNKDYILSNLHNYKKIEKFECKECNLSFLPNFKLLSSFNLLINLDCSNNNIVELPDLYHLTSLEVLLCNNNNLIILPSILPNSLIYLDCSNNKLSRLPNLSNLTFLKKLICNNNNLRELPASLPNSLPTSNAPARACAVSIAGIIPSDLQSNENAYIA